MAKLSKQLMIKVSPKLFNDITKSFSKYLKQTGDPITKAEYIRKILEKEITK